MKRLMQCPVVPIGLAAVLLGGVAQAQDQASARRSQALDEIVVTAQKREENRLDVPASISVLGGEQLEALGAKQLTDYAAYVPGLVVRTGGAPGQARILLRGIVSQGGSGATVGTYIDDAPLGASSGNARAELFQLDLFPYDIERIEILRGPQGTLYGAGTIGGVLKYVTKSPDLTERELRVGTEASSVAHGDDVGWGVRAGVNVPIVSDRLAMRASYFRNRNAGFIDNVATGEEDENSAEQEGGRLSFLWQASDSISVDLTGLMQQFGSGGLSVVDVIKTPTAGPLFGTPEFGDLTRSHPIPEPYSQETQFYSATVDVDLGFANLISASSYSKTQTGQVSDITFAFGPVLPLLGFPNGSLADFGLRLDVEKFTQELRLASSTGDELEWLIGTFFTDEETGNTQTGNAHSPSTDVIGRFTTVNVPAEFQEYALFGNATYKFSDMFDVTAGLRWARNEQSFEQSTFGLLGSATTTGASDDSEVTYMVSARLYPRESTMLYARVATGYRPGGPNGMVPGATGIPPSYDPDTLVNYELGLKSEFADGRAVLELAAFQIDWDNFAAVQIFVTPVGGFGATVNADDARSRGFELATSFGLVDGLQMGLNVAYTDAELTKDAIASLGPLGVDGASLDLVPKWSASLTADYEVSLGDEWRGSLGGAYKYSGERFGMFPRPGTPGQPVIRDHFDAYDVVDLQAGIANDRVAFRLYVRNLFDERAYINGTGIGNYYSVIQPRTVGLSIDLTY